MKKERDAAVDDLLAATLRRRGGTARTGACLDAETLAAWADGTLGAGEQAAAEAHAADCVRCQDVLAAMARTLPPSQATPRAWRLPAFSWLVPLTAAAAALVIWVAVPRRVPVAVSQVAVSDNQAEPAPLSAPAAPLSAPAITPDRADARQRREFAPERDLKKPSAPADALKDQIEIAPEKAAQSANALSDAAAPPAPAAPAPGAAASAAATAAGAPAEARRSAEATSSLRREAPPASSRVSGFAGALETIVVSSNPSTRFRLLRGGAVQRSADAGATWRTEVTGATETLTAGSSPSPSVCWLIGPGGTVLLTTGGGVWRRLAFPEPVDLHAISASDAESATVTTADGHEYVTSDGGVTWSRVQGA